MVSFLLSFGELEIITEYVDVLHINPIALRKAKTANNFGLLSAEELRLVCNLQITKYYSLIQWWSYLEKRICSSENKFFPFRVEPFLARAFSSKEANRKLLPFAKMAEKYQGIPTNLNKDINNARI